MERLRGQRQYLRAVYGLWEVLLCALRDFRHNSMTKEEYGEVFEQTMGSLAALRNERSLAFEAGTELPLEGALRRFGLSPIEEDALLLGLSGAWCAQVYGQLRELQGPGTLHPTVGLLCSILAGVDTTDTDEGLDIKRVLVPHGLLELVGRARWDSPLPVVSQGVFVPSHVADLMAGRARLDQRLVDWAELADPRCNLSDVVCDPDVRLQLDHIVRGLRGGSSEARRIRACWHLLVCGAPGCGKTMIAHGLAKALGRPVLSVAVSEGGTSAIAELSRVLPLAIRNAVHTSAVLVLQHPERLAARTEQDLSAVLGPLMRVVRTAQTIVVYEFGELAEVPQALRADMDFVVRVRRPDVALREQLWESALPPTVSVCADVALGPLAQAYDLTGSAIARAVAWAVQWASSEDERPLAQADLVAGAEGQRRSELDRFASEGAVRLRRAHLVLPEETSERVDELLNACRAHDRVLNDWAFADRMPTGHGIVALFSGDPGTGKTLCAHVLANELGRKLHVIAVPDVVSKWVGETEKHIRELFRQAKSANAILLFDEADSLFATRVKVERAQDHYQNMEVNVLLQEIESYGGIVLLTTNMQRNLDPAFERRILFKIDFPLPEASLRAKLWETMIPTSSSMLVDVDWGYLAKTFDLTGGQIKNAVLRAALRCAARGGMLEMEALVVAAHEEARSMGQLTQGVDTALAAYRRQKSGGGESR